MFLSLSLWIQNKLKGWRGENFLTFFANAHSSFFFAQDVFEIIFSDRVSHTFYLSQESTKMSVQVVLRQSPMFHLI